MNALCARRTGRWEWPSPSFPWQLSITGTPGRAFPSRGSVARRARRSNGGLYALPHKLIERRKRHSSLALPAFGFAQAPAFLSFRRGGDQAPVGVYGLQGAFFGGDVVGERTHHGAAGHGYGLLASCQPGGIGTSYVAHRRALDVALDTGELTREEEGGFAKRLSYPHRGVQHMIGGKVGVAVHDAHAGEVGVS